MSISGPSQETESSESGTRLSSRIFHASNTISQVARHIEKSGEVLVGRAGEGVTGFLLAGLLERSSRPILAVTSSLDEAERLRRDWSTFSDSAVHVFPPWESLFEADSEPDPDTFRERSECAEGLVTGSVRAAVAPVQAILQPIRRPDANTDRRILLRSGDRFPPETLARNLVDAGYRRFPQVARPGDFSIRGGIFDVYPREGSHPYRIDFFDDEIESIRSVSTRDQRSGAEVSLLVLTLLPKRDYFIRGFTGEETILFEDLPEDIVLALPSPRDLEEKTRGLIAQWSAKSKSRNLSDEFWARAGKFTHLHLDPLIPETGRQAIQLPCGSTEAFTGSLDSSVKAIETEVLQGTELRIFFRQEAEVERFTEVLSEAGIGGDGPPLVQPTLGDLSRGFRWEEPVGGVFLSGSAALGRSRTMSRRAKQRAEGRAVDSFLELEEGAHVVHVTHGIARFRGIRHQRQGRRQGDFLVLEYAEGVQLLVPIERIDLVQKYVGGKGRYMRLDKLGGATWSKKKARVSEGLHDLAAELLEMQALRTEREGMAFPPDNKWQLEFEAAFPFEETPDQLSSIEAIRTDMESHKPMDRLICGDVGFGKTEVAMRAAFKAVQANRQVAVLVPTTVLAEQHRLTFRDRMAEFPVSVDALSRLRSRKEQTEILKRASEGKLDILIGTHRLLSQDVHFKNLGLIVIDEEQRFGVAHKERLKHLRRLADVLTLTATPIPRTLHMSLVGVKDISSLTDPPQGRNPVHTEVCHFDSDRFRRILLRELNRDGQVFYLHNRVKSLSAKRRDLEQLVPEGRMIDVHGQMNEHQLEERMKKFLMKEADVLVSTTIIESGLDIPSANTIVIDNAHRFGLAELHQLRGRVGRGTHKAYCYLLLPGDKPIKPEARHRLQAIEEFSELGSGFQIAMRDLEIRGAGNILGKEQSGHISSVGYDLYCRLLERAIADIRGTPWQEPPDIEIGLEGSTRIPAEYIGDTRQRLRAYRSIATALTTEEIALIEDDLVDRYGPVPKETVALLCLQRLRILLGRWGVKRIDFEEGWLIFEGDRSAILRALQGKGWKIVELPDGQVGGRPQRSVELGDLDSVFSIMGVA